MQSLEPTLISRPLGVPIDVGNRSTAAMAPARVALLVGASLLVGAVAAQPVPCASVAPEVRDRVREAGACRDAADDAAPGAAVAPPATVTMKLSDGTVVRVPSDIGANMSANINDPRKRAPTSPPAAKGAPRARASTQTETKSANDSPPAAQELKVPDVLGRNYADLGGMLGEFKVDQISTASAAPAGVIVAQQPLPGAVVVAGSTVSLRVSDGSLSAATASTSSVTPTTDTRGPAPAASTANSPRASVVDSPPPAARISQPPPPAQVPILVSVNSALILGVGVVLGLIVGALLTRRWLLRRESLDWKTLTEPTLDQVHPVDSVIGADTTEAPEVRFTARRDPHETTIELVPVGNDEVMATEEAGAKDG